MKTKTNRIHFAAVTGICVIALAMFFASGCGKKESGEGKKKLNLYIWSAYLSDELINKFQKETGVEVHYDTYDSNEALEEKLQSGIAEYDIVVPSDYTVRRLVVQNLLENLDHKRLSNIKNISPRLLNLSFDPQNAHSIPFLWGTAGIGYDKTKVTEPVDSWGVLWNPKFKDQILMLDDMRECFAVALKWKGHSVNSKNPAELEEAKNLLTQQKPLVKIYSSSDFDEKLLSGDVWLAHGWSGQLAKAKDHKPGLAYVVPKEGATIWVDCMAIPKTAPHKDEAYMFMNWVMDAQVAADITNFSGYPSPNEAAKAYIKPEYLNDPARYPDEATLSKCEFLEDLGEATQIMDRYWTEIKSR
jgi:spermidine/putrescine-binding protein